MDKSLWLYTQGKTTELCHYSELLLWGESNNKPSQKSEKLSDDLTITTIWFCGEA